MNRLFASVAFVAFTATFGLGVPAPKDKKETKEELVKKDLDSLEGTWKVVSCVTDGREESAEVLAAMPSITFKGTKITQSDGGTAEISSLDPTATPKIIDYKLDDVGKELEVQHGIYKLDGDEYTDCVSLGADKERPKEFASKKGSGYVLMKYKRVKEQVKE